MPDSCRALSRDDNSRNLSRESKRRDVGIVARIFTRAHNRSESGLFGSCSRRKVDGRGARSKVATFRVTC